MTPKFRVGMRVYCPFNGNGVRRQMLSIVTTVEDCPLPPTSRYYKDFFGPKEILMDGPWYEVVTMDWQEAQIVAECLLSTPEEAVAKRLMQERRTR